MILTRKLLAPTLILLAVLLVGLFTYFFISLHDAYHEAEEGSLVFFSTSFNSEIENQKQLALALATDTAGNTAVQAALANRNKQELVNLSSVSFSNLMETANIVIYHYYLPDGKIFLAANDPSAALTEREPSRAALLASANQSPVSGLEVEGDALGIIGIAPVYYQGRFAGMVEIGVGLNDALLDQMKEKYGGEWRVLITKDHASSELGEESPNANLMVLAATEGSSLFNSAESYVQVQTGTSTITHPSENGKDYAIQSSPIFDFSGELVGVLDIIYDHTHITSAQNNRLLIAGLVTVGVLTLGILALIVITRRTLQPIQVLIRAAAEITEGNFAAYVNIESEDDEIGVLIQAFNRMTTQLRGSIASLEERIADRTHELEEQSLRLRAATEISQFSSSERELTKIIERSGQLLVDRFGHYHVGIFLLENDGQHAILSSSPTKVGRQMIENNVGVAIKDETVIGYVARTGESRITPDARFPSTLFSDTHLPGSRSQITLALKTENRVIGILDIHSDKAEAFKQEDLSVMQIVADQLATAIERARLAQESALNLSELAQAYGEFTREGWRNFGAASQLERRGYRFNNIRIEPVDEVSEFGRQAIEKGSTISTPPSQPSQEVAVPIKFRGQTIGVVHAKLREGAGDTVIATLEQAIDRLASSLESARLYEEAQLRANREQAISQIAGLIGSSSDYETILRTTVREIGNVINDSEVLIQIAGNLGDER